MPQCFKSSTDPLPLYGEYGEHGMLARCRALLKSPSFWLGCLVGFLALLALTAALLVVFNDSAHLVDLITHSSSTVSTLASFSVFGPWLKPRHCLMPGNGMLNYLMGQWVLVDSLTARQLRSSMHVRYIVF